MATIKEEQFIRWEELTISNNRSQNPPTESITGRSIVEDVPEVLAYKEKILSYLKNITIEFYPLDFLKTDLKGNIKLKYGRNTNVIHKYLAAMKNDDLLVTYEKAYQFYRSHFYFDAELLDLLSIYLLSLGRISDFKMIAERFLSNSTLPDKYRYFLVLSELMELTVNEKVQDYDLLPILYRIQKGNFTNIEREYIYDFVISNTSSELAGLGFYFYKNSFTGIRNIFPILKILLKDFETLSLDEKKELLEEFKSTNNYLRTYFLMKRVYDREEIKKWLNGVKKINCKFKTDPDAAITSLKSLKLDMELLNKYQILKDNKLIYTMNPFEILLFLNSTEYFPLRQAILECMSDSPNSYSNNRAYATLNFFEKDYYTFLNHIQKSGRLQYQPDAVYLRAIALLELGLKEESKALFYALELKFPDSILLKNAVEQYVGK